MTRHWLKTLRQLEAEVFQEPAWCPAADVYRTDEGWLLKFDLAGVRPEDLSVTAEGNQLTVSGRRRDLVCGQSCHHQQLEIAYSQFSRTMELPLTLDSAEITSQFHEGMLLVRIRTREV